MTTLALDVGSSSVKAQLFTNRRGIGEPTRAGYSTRHDATKVEVDPNEVLRAVAEAIAHLGTRAASADVIALSVMAPAWVAMDKNGQAITPIVTHQDRRSVEIARQLEKTVGKARHLQLAGNLPFPGGISSTTCAWFLANQKETMARAALVGHLNTFLNRQMTGARVIDPSNASFTGLYLTCDLGGWSDELCRAVGISTAVLPEVVEADQVAGHITADAAERFGVKQGTPVQCGMVDTSAAMLWTGAHDGQLFHMCGSTDVLAMACDRPVPNERLLTRALGVGKKWISAATLAAAGSSLEWMKTQVFSDLSDEQFYKLIAGLLRKNEKSPVHFEPYLAGERTSIEQKQASFSGLTLSTRREDMLGGMIEALAIASGSRLKLLAQVNASPLKTVYVSGGAGGLADLMHRDWPGDWDFHYVSEANLLGLGGQSAEN